MKNNDVLHLDIATLHEDGYGLTSDGRHGVFGSLPDESVVSFPFAKKRRRLYSRADTIEKASTDRVIARCDAAGYCGGCSLQHMSSGAQLKFKQAQLAHEFGIYKPDAWLPPLSGNGFHYRCKARLGVKFVEKKGRILVGFREKMKPYIAELTICHVLKEPVGNLLNALATLVELLSNPRVIPQIEVAIGDTGCALLFRHMEELTHADIEVLRQFGQSHALDIYLQPGNPESLHKIFPLLGEDRLYYQLPRFDLEMAFHPLDFTQVNLGINRQMVNLAVELLELRSTDTVLDAFCGIGNFSLAIARRCHRVVGLEGTAASVARAAENSDRNKITNAGFSVLDLFNPENLADSLLDIDKVLVDPPRTGALELCKKLATSAVERVVYVSCNPRTLARDVQMLVEAGFHLKRLGIIDMFPHTTHVESIALLTRS